MEDRRLKEYRKILQKIEDTLPKYKKMTDDELKSQTTKLKKKIKDGTPGEKLIVEAFCTIIEADLRVLGMQPYPNQILGALALYHGNIAEIGTGEGKSLVGTMPLYARALEDTGGNFLITSNGYLAKRDAEEMGIVYTWLGLTLGVGVTGEEEKTDEERQDLYESDIIYSTSSNLGFDYLYDNLGAEVRTQVVNRFHYAILDEVDEVLLDSAQTALVISGAPKVQSNLFPISDWFVKGLAKEDYEYSEDKKSVWFTKSGLARAEETFDVKGILSQEQKELYKHLVLALHANYLRKANIDYIVRDTINLIDGISGRELVGVRLQGGNHQAIEAKEGVEITAETNPLGTISFQNLFKKFTILSGMTGTGKTDEEEFREVFQMDVIQIPPNKPKRRVDEPDVVYLTNDAKILEAVKLLQINAGRKRPILIQAGNIKNARTISMLLLEKHLAHHLLDAQTQAKEEKIIKEAGKKNSILVTTAIAGRGTDIKLEKSVKEGQGLLVIGTERMDSPRIDGQLIGRAGRQGDPGRSIFYVSLEDKVVQDYGANWVEPTHDKMVEKAEKGEIKARDPLKKKRFKRVIMQAQQKAQLQGQDGRRKTLEFDGIVSTQRQVVYDARNKILKEEDGILEDVLDQCITRAIDDFVSDSENLNKKAVLDFLFNNVDYNYDLTRVGTDFPNFQKETIQNFLLDYSKIESQKTLSNVRVGDQLIYFKKIVLLKAIDTVWVEQLDNLQQLKAMISGRDLGQHKSINEFQVEARKSFGQMQDKMWLQIFRNLLLIEVSHNKDGTINVEFP